MQNDAPLGLSNEIGGNFWFAIMEFYKPQHIFYSLQLGLGCESSGMIKTKHVSHAFHSCFNCTKQIKRKFSAIWNQKWVMDSSNFHLDSTWES